MRILDVTTFFNEVELLKVRLEENWDFVDTFVITEADCTYSKNPKPFNFLDNQKVFNPYMEKIHYIPLTGASHLFGSDTRSNQNIQQYYPFYSFPEYLTNYDYCIHNDQDEILDRRHWPRLLEVLKNRSPKHVRVGLRHFRNYLNWEYKNNYTVQRISKIVPDKSFLKIETKMDILSLDGFFGYHLCFMGGKDRVKYKLKNFMHFAEVFDSLSEEDTVYYKREAKYGNPVVLSDPKEHMPKAIRDSWDTFKEWVNE